MAGGAQMVAPRLRSTPGARRPLRLLSAAAVVAGLATLTLVLLSVVVPTDSSADAFCGSTGTPCLRASSLDMAGGVAMEVKSGRWSAGMPNVGEISRRKVTMPSLQNLKDQYFIVWVRSKMIKQWYPFNIISGAEAAKQLKSVAKNDIAKAVGVDKLADFQVVKAIGMSLYKQKDEVKKQALKMHPSLQYAAEVEYGYKEILNNTEFNKNPNPFMQSVNISKIPPEDELRNLLDDAADAAGKVGESITKASDNVKGFFSGFSR